MRIITGRPVFFDSKAGIAIVCAPGIFPPNPPPQYSLMTTTSLCGMPTQPDTLATVRATDCVEPCRYSLPFCQYAIAVRGSIG